MSIPLFILIFSSLSFSQDTVYIDFTSNTFASKSAIPSNSNEPEYFTLSLNSNSIKIDSRGRCPELNFTLHVDTCCVIESIEYLQTNATTVYFQITETDYDGAGSKIIKYDLSAKKELWQNQTGGFNVHSFIIYGDYIYLNSIGFLGKMNKISGKYIWKHEDLYEKYKANYFENIIIHKDTVEGIIYRDIFQKWKLIFDQKSGKVINVIKNVSDKVLN
jgi:hypothetical protein